MHLLLALIIATAPSMLPSGSRGYLDGGQLEHLCMSPGSDDNGALGLCLGYLAGSMDQLLAGASSAPTRALSVCPPSEVTVEQLRLLVVAHLRVHPRDRASAAASVVEKVVAGAYPCPLFGS